MGEFWDLSFIEKGMMWGNIPSNSAVHSKDSFLLQGIKDILIPGIGYGRNANIFLENGIGVTGIEISETAVNLAKKNIPNIKIYNGSVMNMPFDNHLYDGIFCYGLIHLFNRTERRKIIESCYNQLKSEGYMIFSVISKDAPMFENGKKLSKDRFKMVSGVKLFFYDENSIKKEFKNFGLLGFREIYEEGGNSENKKMLKFLIIECKK